MALAITSSSLTPRTNEQISKCSKNSFLNPPSPSLWRLLEAVDYRQPNLANWIGDGAHYDICAHGYASCRTSRRELCDEGSDASSGRFGPDSGGARFGCCVSLELD